MSEWIDITRVLVDGLAGWPGDPVFRLRRVAEIERDGVTVTEICTSAHMGTHIDAPLHCFADGEDVASIPLGTLCGSAVVVDVAGGAEVSSAVLEAAGIRAGDRVLLRGMEEVDAETRGHRDAERGRQDEGQMGRRGEGVNREDDAETRGHGDAEREERNHSRGRLCYMAVLTAEAAKWLVEHGAVLVGMDSMSPDLPDDPDLPVHRVLLGAGVPILEGLDLRGVTPGRYELIALPLLIKGAEASPVRVMVRARGEG